MRIFFGITGQLGYGGLVQQSVILVKFLREFGCEVFPLVGLAPPYNDEVDLDELDYTFEAFNIADYVLRDKPSFLRWLLGWYARHQVARTHPKKLRRLNGGTSKIDVDVKRVLQNLIYNPDEGDIEKVAKLRRDFRPDIDYACELSMAGYFGALDDLGIPLVTSAQGYELCQRFGVDLVPVIRANAERIDAVISGSYANVRENVARDLPFLLPKTRVIHYGIVNDHHYEMSREEAERRTSRFVGKTDDFTIVSLGRMEVEKGVDLALHAIRILLNEGIKVRLRIVGDWPMNDHFYPILQSKVSMMDLNDHVDCIGFVESKPDKVALLKTSDAMLATFIKSEPFGLVLCEAMSAAIPVVCPDTGAGPEILSWNGIRSGLVYRTQDTGQMADRIRHLIEHPEERKQMGYNGALAVRQYFHARRMAADILRLFEELVEQKRSRARSVSAAPDVAAPALGDSLPPPSPGRALRAYL
ncbi:MAG: glycosyltransferase family 4 protein [Chloroflexi bacterium]|nr:glycosyltransferase family 4 protein [Chloroflexota bacterium]